PSGRRRGGLRRGLRASLRTSRSARGSFETPEDIAPRAEVPKRSVCATAKERCLLPVATLVAGAEALLASSAEGAALRRQRRPARDVIEVRGVDQAQVLRLPVGAAVLIDRREVDVGRALA